MPRKVNLPGADELFRATQPQRPESPAKPAAPAGGYSAESGFSAESPASAIARLESSGRVRHDEKITVYVSREELLAVEQLRIRLRGEFHLSVDRGRLVREAVAIAIADVAEHGADSELLRRLDKR